MRNQKPKVAVISLFLGIIVFVGGTTSAQTERFVTMAKKIVTAINTGVVDDVANDFGEQMKQALPPEKAKAYFQNLVTEHGKIVKLGEPRLIPPMQAVFTVHFEKDDLEMKLYINEENKILGFGFSPAAAASPTPQNTENKPVETKTVQNQPNTADDLFKGGKFAEAEKAYTKIIDKDKSNYDAALRLGQIALLGNKFDAARKWLTKASQLKPDEKTPKSLLAEVAYRQDDFATAATLFAAAGRAEKVKQLESFKGLKPYQVENPAEITRVKFIHTDPLPLVQVKVNGGESVNFLIDTGGGELILDTDFAKTVGAAMFGSETGIFGGNTTASTGLGRIDSLTLGDWVIKNVPIHTLNTKPFSSAANGKKVDGIIGTNLLYHFISTIDYQKGELVLQRKSKSALKNLVKQMPISIPFWLAGDHLIVAWGTANQSQPILMLVDTGLAGGGFVCPQSTLDAIGVKLTENQGSEGTFGGGKAKIIPFTVKELTLGNVKEQNLTAIFGAFPTKLEYGQGFRIGGLISHQFFRSYSLTMDFNGMKLLLKKG